MERGTRKLKNRFDNDVDLVFQLGSESGAVRLLVVDLLVDLGDCESMNSKLQRFGRALRRRRT